MSTVAIVTVGIPAARAACLHGEEIVVMVEV